MELQLLNFDYFIKTNNLGEVKTYRIPGKSYDADGLWSEVIFGPIGSKIRLERFGFIDLDTKFIHPEAYDIIATISDETSKIVREKARFIIQDKQYIEDNSGQTGIAFLINTLEQVDLTKFCHKHKLDHAKYIEKSKKFILIDKFLVMPAGMRDYDIYGSQAGRQMDEINSLYTKLIVYKNQLTGIDELDDIIKRKIQNQLIEITDHIKKTKMTGKKGLFRGTMLRKSLDYTSRLVLTNDPSIKIGEIGLPWHTLVAIYEPFVIYHLFKIENENNTNLISQLKELTKTPHFDDQSFSKFVKSLITSPENVPDAIKFGLIEILNQFLDKQIVMAKRDPVQARKSWFAAKPVITHGRVAYVNSMDLGPIGGDCINGNIITYYKHDDNKFIQKSEPIDLFYRFHDLELIEVRNRHHDNVIIYDFLVKDPVYSLGVNELTGEFEYSKIQRWSIHQNITMSSIVFNNNSRMNISNNKSCYVFDRQRTSYDKLNVTELNPSNNELFFIGCDVSNKIQYIPINNCNVTKYKDTSPVFIEFNVQDGHGQNYTIKIESVKNEIAYDLTMEHEHVRSFLHESGFFAANSDGDTIAVVPVFTNEAKEEVRKTMMPTETKSKWVDPSSYNNIIYAPSLDAIATIYRATKT